MNTDNLSTPADKDEEIKVLRESYRLLKEENEKNAIAFAEWMDGKNWGHYAGNGIWKVGRHTKRTTAEIYEIFKRERNNPSTK